MTNIKFDDIDLSKLAGETMEIVHNFNQLKVVSDDYDEFMKDNIELEDDNLFLKAIETCKEQYISKLLGIQPVKEEIEVELDILDYNTNHPTTFEYKEDSVYTHITLVSFEGYETIYSIGNVNFKKYTDDVDGIDFEDRELELINVSILSPFESSINLTYRFRNYGPFEEADARKRNNSIIDYYLPHTVLTEIIIYGFQDKNNVPYWKKLMIHSFVNLNFKNYRIAIITLYTAFEEYINSLLDEIIKNRDASEITNELFYVVSKTLGFNNDGTIKIKNSITNKIKFLAGSTYTFDVKKGKNGNESFIIPNHYQIEYKYLIDYEKIRNLIAHGNEIDMDKIDVANKINELLDSQILKSVNNNDKLENQEKIYFKFLYSFLNLICRLGGRSGVSELLYMSS